MPLTINRLAAPALFLVAASEVALVLVALAFAGVAKANAAPRRAVETITPAAAVISTAHYQARLALTCNSSAGFCVGYFPDVPGRRKLNLTRMSCYLQTSTYATYATGKIVLHPLTGDDSLVQYLAADHSTDWGHHVINQAIDVEVAARQHISVALIVASGGQTQAADCTAHGTLETLQ